MRKKTKKFSYRRRSPYVLLDRITKFELEAIDHFLELAGNAHATERQALEGLQQSASTGVPDDWLIDDFVQLGNFARLAAEFAIVGLWRCVELYRQRALLLELGEDAARQAFSNKQFEAHLISLGIKETRISCWKSVNELRCLNNCIKHSGRVDSELATISRWKKKKGRKLENLEAHFQRLRPLVPRYLQDVSRRLNHARS